MIVRISSIFLLTLSVLFETYSQNGAGLHISHNLDVFRVEGLDGNFIEKEFYQSNSYADMSVSRISVGWYWRKNQKHTQEIFASVSSEAPIPYTYYEREDVPLEFDFSYLSVGYQSIYTILSEENHITALGLRGCLYQFNYSDLPIERNAMYTDIQQESYGVLLNAVLKRSYTLNRFEFGVSSILSLFDFNYTRHWHNNPAMYFNNNTDNILSEGFSFKLFPAAFSISMSVGYKFKSE